MICHFGENRGASGPKPGANWINCTNNTKLVGLITIRFGINQNIGKVFNMAGFSKIDGPADPNEDVIIIRLGRSLTEEQFERVQRSIIAFMNVRWPDIAHVGIDN